MGRFYADNSSGLGLLFHIDGTPPPKTGTASSAVSTDSSSSVPPSHLATCGSWRDDDDRAMAVITQSLELNVHMEVIHIKTVHEIWDHYNGCLSIPTPSNALPSPKRCPMLYRVTVKFASLPLIFDPSNVSRISSVSACDGCQRCHCTTPLERDCEALRT